MPKRPLQADIYQAAVDFKTALIDRDDIASERIIKAYTRSFAKMSANIRVLTEKIERARAAGQYISPSWAFRIDRYESLQKQIVAEITRIVSDVDTSITANQTAAVQQAVANAGTLVELGAQNTGVSVSFSQLPKAATESIVGFLSDGSPLKDLLDKLPGLAGQAVAEALTDSITRGLGANATARNIRNALGGNMTRALTIARTETMRAYREATSRTFNQNRDILVGWVWVASFSRRTCASCLALAGTVHRLEERMESHPRCRCVAQPLLRGQAVGVEKGDVWFAKQSAEMQRAILGSNVATQAYRDGKVTLLDFVGRQNSAKWGRPYYQLSTKKAILKQGQFPGYNEPTNIFPLDQLFTVPEPPMPPVPPVAPPPAAPAAPAASAGKKTRKRKTSTASPAPLPAAAIPSSPQRTYKEFPKLSPRQTAVDIAQYADETYPFNQLTAKITGDELKSLQEYTRTIYRDINQYLRTGAPQRLSTNQLKERIRNIDLVLGKTTIAEDTLLFRAVHMPRFHQLAKQKELIGNVWQDRGYLSTTMNPDVAERFAMGQSTPVLMRIKANKGQLGTYISHVERPLRSDTYHNGEGEVLLPRNTMLFITDAKYVKINRKKVLEVEAEIWTEEMVASKKAKIVD